MREIDPLARIMEFASYEALKINDAGTVSGRSSLGAVVRNTDNQLVFATTKSLRVAVDSGLVELWAILLGVHMAIEKGGGRLLWRMMVSRSSKC